MRNINCFDCGKNLATLVNGSSILKEGFRAYCLKCSLKQSQKMKQGEESFLRGFANMFGSDEVGR